MYRVLKLSGNYYATDIDLEDDDDLENVRIFASEGTPVIIAEELDEAADLVGIESEDIQILNRD